MSQTIAEAAQSAHRRCEIKMETKTKKSKLIFAAMLVLLACMIISFAAGVLIGKRKYRNWWAPNVSISMTSGHLGNALDIYDMVQSGDKDKSSEKLKEHIFSLLMWLRLNIPYDKPMEFDSSAKVYNVFYRINHNPQYLPDGEIYKPFKDKLPWLLRFAESNRNESLRKELMKMKIPADQFEAVYQDATNKWITQRPAGG